MPQFGIYTVRTHGEYSFLYGKALFLSTIKNVAAYVGRFYLMTSRAVAQSKIILNVCSVDL